MEANVSGAGSMAKKRLGRPNVKKKRIHVLGMKGYPEWKDWLDRLTAFKKAMATSQVVEAALRMYARNEGFEEPPQR